MKQASKIIGTKALGKYFTLLTSPPKPHVFVSLPLQSEVLTPELVDTVVSLCNQLESYLDSTEIDIYDFLPKVELEDVPQPQPDEMDFSLKSTGFSEPESGKDLFQSCCDTKINSSNLPTQDYINDVRDITAFPVTVNSIHDIDTNLWTHGYNSPVTIRAVNFITDIRREMFDNILNARIIEPYNGIDSFRVEYYRDLAHPPLLFSPQDYYTSTAINRVIQLHADFINLMTSTINNINPVDQNFIHSLLCIARNYQYTPQFIIDALSGLSSNSCTLSHMQVLERSLNKIIWMIMNLNYWVNSFSRDLWGYHLTMIGTYHDYRVVMQPGDISPDVPLIEDVSRNVTRIIDYIDYINRETARYINYETNIHYPIPDGSRFSKCCQLIETIINFFNNLFRRV